MWVNHHHLMDQFERADRVLLFLNLLLLMGVVFIPFPTALIGENIRGDGRRGGGDRLRHHGDLPVDLLQRPLALRTARTSCGPDCDPKVVSGISRSYLPGVLLYLTGTLIALGSPVGSAIFYAAIAVFYAVSNTFFGKEPVEAPVRAT